jgi:hypothetical protein
MSKGARNKIPPATNNQSQFGILAPPKLAPLTNAEIIAMGITVKILKNVVNRLRALSG